MQGSKNYHRKGEELKIYHTLKELAQGKRNGHEPAGRQWEWCKRAGERDPSLPTSTADEGKEGKGWLLNPIVHLAQFIRRTEGTKESRLPTTRYLHLLEGTPDPLGLKGRSWLALAGIRKFAVRNRRKLPATVEGLKRVRKQLGDDALGSKVRWAASAPAFGFALKAEEHRTADGVPWQRDQVACGGDDVTRCGGAAAKQFVFADEHALHIKPPKTNQCNVGQAGNRHRAHSGICPLAALAEMLSAFPECWGSEGGSHFSAELGKVLKHQEVQPMVSGAGLAAGSSPEKAGGHSLRSSGASAMRHPARDRAIAKPFGRWQSDAPHGHQ